MRSRILGLTIAEHAAALQHELDDLNKAFGITGGVGERA
jgi:hypothetical protein